MKNPRFNNIHKVSDIVDTMIKGLKREWVKVSMSSFGYAEGKICFGCAATNAVCELMQKSFSPENIGDKFGQAEEFNYSISTHDLRQFEYAIDDLRVGRLIDFIDRLEEISGITGVDISSKVRKAVSSYIREKKWWREERILPYLSTWDYKENLVYYEKFRDWLIKKGL